MDAMETAATTRQLETPDVTLAYDVRGPLPTTDGRPPLMLVASPMDAEGFATLAGLLTDRTVVTYDPRGMGRSTRHDGRTDLTPETNAADQHAVIEALGGRAGRDVRQQRRCGQRTRAGGRTPRAT